MNIDYRESWLDIKPPSVGATGASSQRSLSPTSAGACIVYHRGQGPPRKDPVGKGQQPSQVGDQPSHTRFLSTVLLH